MTKRSGDLLIRKANDERVFHWNHLVIKPNNLFEVHATNNLWIDAKDFDFSQLTELEDDIDIFLSRQAKNKLELSPSKQLFDFIYKKDVLLVKVLQKIANDIRYSKKINLTQCFPMIKTIIISQKALAPWLSKYSFTNITRQSWYIFSWAI